MVVHRGLAAAVSGSAVADTIADAHTAGSGVNRIVYSTITRTDAAGEIRLHSVVFDANGHRFLHEHTVTGNVLQAINRMAASITPEPNPLGAKSEDALKKWPIFTGDAGAFEKSCLSLAETEPGFGAALGVCARQLTASRRLDAVRELMGRIPEDRARDFSPEVQSSFGDAYMALKDYATAASTFRKIAANRPGVKNILAYAESLAGNCAEGKRLLEENSRIAEEEANALDSLGEISFFCGEFAEAEQYFLASGPKWSGARLSQNVVEPLKAAAARIMTGDTAGANQMASAHFQKMSKANPQAVSSLQSVWTSISGAANPEARRKAIEASLIPRP